MRTLGLLVVLLIGCSDVGTSSSDSQANSTPADWVPVTASCGYTFRAPPTLVADEVQGIDSCVDRWSMGSCQLSGDLGEYSGPSIEMPGLLDFWESSETIDGRVAQLSTARYQLASAAWQFQSSVHFSVVDPDRPETTLKVSAYCARETERDETLLLFRTIRF